MLHALGSPFGLENEDTLKFSFEPNHDRTIRANLTIVGPSTFAPFRSVRASDLEVRESDAYPQLRKLVGFEQSAAPDCLRWISGQRLSVQPYE